MIYLVVGRTGSGKDYLVNLLAKEGLNVVKSYTTRPKRSETEDTHIFITPEESATITDKVATTEINGYEYFATAAQVNDADIYIIDPNGIKELTANMPDTTFHIIYVTANDVDRRFNAVKRAENKIKEEQIFDSRDENEDAQFSEFEEQLKHLNENNVFPPNVTVIHVYENDYNEATANEHVQFYMHELELHNRMTKIIEECVALKLIMPNEDDTDKINVANTDASIRSVTKEHFTDVVLSNQSKMLDLMRGYITLSDKFALTK